MTRLFLCDSPSVRQLLPILKCHQLLGETTLIDNEIPLEDLFMKFLPLLIIDTTFFMASCSIKMHKRQKARSLEVNVKSNLHADLDVVFYEGDQSGWFSIANAVVTSKADVIVAPQSNKSEELFFWGL